VAESPTQVDGSGNVVPNGEFTRQLLVTVNGANLLTLEVIVTGPRRSFRPGRCW
jgi:hypothetical protein